MVSGFLITRLLVGEREQTGTINLAHFYERRARRLLPALSVVVLATLLFGYVLLPFPNAHHDLGQSALFTLAFAANRYVRLYVGGYFQDGVDLTPLAHTWSLGVEEQFYLFYPLALIVFFRFAPRAKRAWLRGTGAGVTLASFALSVALTLSATTRAFYWAPSRAWELGVGALMALWIAEAPSPRPAFGTMLSAAGLVAIGTAFATLTPESTFPGALALAPVLGTAMIIAAVPLAPLSLISRILSTRPLVALGRVSYAWYLWHWPILVFARRWRLGDTNVPADIGWVLLALVLAILTTQFIERPFRHQTAFLAPRTRSFALLAAGTTAALVALSLGLMHLDRLWPGAARQVEVATPPWPCRAGTWKDTLTFGSCAAPPPVHPVAVALWGDSHAAAWAPAAQILGDSLDATVFQLTRSGCAPLIGVAPLHHRQPEPQCVRANDAFTAWLRSTAATQVRGVMLIAWWTRYMRGGLDSVQYARAHDLRDAVPWSTPSDVRAGLERSLAFADSAGLRVLIVLPPPDFPHSVPACAAIRAVAQCGVSRAEEDLYRSSSIALVREVARAHRNVRVMDPIAFFCDSLSCPAEPHGIMATRDASHVSQAAARAFAPYMREDFRWLIAAR